MTFGNFLEYVDMYVSGRLFHDHTYRNYDLLWKATDRRLRRALVSCGFRHEELSVSLAECATRVRERGYTELPEMALRQCLLEWYVWQRIERGGLRKWKWNATTTSSK